MSKTENLPAPAPQTAAPAQSLPAKRASVIGTLAAQLNCDPQTLLGVLKKSVFAACKTDEEFQMACMTAAKYGLDPVQKEIYAFPAKSGAVVPVVGVDGWIKIMNSAPNFDGIEFDETPESCTAIVHLKDRSHPVKVTEWLEECRRGTEPWKNWPRRMLRHKAMIQAARLAFGFSGIVDEDEAQRRDEAAAAAATPAQSVPPVARPSSRLRAALDLPPEDAVPVDEPPAPSKDAAHDAPPAPDGDALPGFDKGA